MAPRPTEPASSSSHHDCHVMAFSLVFPTPISNSSSLLPDPPWAIPAPTEVATNQLTNHYVFCACELYWGGREEEREGVGGGRQFEEKMV